MGLTFAKAFDQVRQSGFRSINATYPEKELVTSKVMVADPLMRAIGTVKAVVFEVDGPKGINTGYSGFMNAYLAGQGTANPGKACLMGTGGVGKATRSAPHQFWPVFQGL